MTVVYLRARGRQNCGCWVWKTEGHLRRGAGKIGGYCSCVGLCSECCHGLSKGGRRNRRGRCRVAQESILNDAGRLRSGRMLRIRPTNVVQQGRMRLGQHFAGLRRVQKGEDLIRWREGEGLEIRSESRVVCVLAASVWCRRGRGTHRGMHAEAKLKRPGANKEPSF